MHSEFAIRVFKKGTDVLREKGIETFAALTDIQRGLEEGIHPFGNLPYFLPIHNVFRKRRSLGFLTVELNRLFPVHKYNYRLFLKPASSIDVYSHECVREPPGRRRTLAVTRSLSGERRGIGPDNRSSCYDEIPSK